MIGCRRPRRDGPAVAAGLIATVVILTTMPAPDARTRQDPIFRGGAHGVQVDVSVRSGNNPVPGLTSEDFRLTDNGVEQTVEAVAIEAVPIDVTLLIDTSGSAQAVLERFKADVQRCANLLRPDDRVRLVGVSEQVTEVFAMQAPSTHLTVDGLTVGGGTAINDAVVYAFAWDPGLDRRHLIVAFTDGQDNLSFTEPETVLAIASRQDAVMHVVLSDASTPAAAGPSGTERAERASRSNLVEAAARSGGAVHRVVDAVTAFGEALDDFRKSYTLYYSPRGVTPAGWHDLQVTLRKATAGPLTIRARRGYTGG